MAPNNSRVTPDTAVRSPARSFLQSLDNFYAPARDVRGERSFQEGLGAVSGLFEEKAAEAKNERRKGEHSQGVQDAMREEAGQEMRGVKTGSIFRQHSKYYMAGLNETRGKAAAARFKADTALAYEQWDGKHVDDDGTAFRDWMNGRVGEFMATLGDDQYKVSGALPTIDEVARNYAAQHTGFTANRLEQESFEAYDEIVTGIFTDLANGDIGMDVAVAALGAEADDMYDTDGAKANDRVVDAAIRYANIHNDPDAILAMARAHDSGKLKLSQPNREKLANAMDAVEADIERNAGKENARATAEAKAARTATLNAWGAVLVDDPYADLPTFTEVGDQQTYRDMVTLQDAFIKGATVENPTMTTIQRMAFEADLYSSTTARERISVLAEFTRSNPTALSGADVARYTKEIFAANDPGSLINSPIVSKYRDTFGQTLAEVHLGLGFDMNRVSYLRTQGERHFNDYMLANAGTVDMNNPEAIHQAIEKAKQYSEEMLVNDFPEIIRDKLDEQPELGSTTGLGDALTEQDDAVRAGWQAAEAAEFARLAEEAAAKAAGDSAADAETEVEGGVATQMDAQANTVEEELSIEDQPAPFEDPDSDEEYPPIRDGFYGELLHRFTNPHDSHSNRMKEAWEIVAEDPEFGEGITRLATKYSVPEAALLAIMDFETGGSFSPSQKNGAGSGATGLIQFMPETARSLGTTVEELAGMTRGEQLVYVEKYFDQFGTRIRGGQIDDLYMAVLYPKAIGKPDGYALFKAGTKAYEQNAGLDTNEDGTITKFEAAAKAKAAFYGY